MCHQHHSSFCYRRVQGSSANSTLLLVINALLKLSGRYHPEHTPTMYKKMSSKENPLQYLTDKIFGLSCFSGMMKIGDVMKIMKTCCSADLEMQSPLEFHLGGDAYTLCRAEGGVCGWLSRQSAGLMHSHKSLNSLPWPTVGISLWCSTLFGDVQPPDIWMRQLSFGYSSSVPSSTFWALKRAWPEPSRAF